MKATATKRNHSPLEYVDIRQMRKSLTKRSKSLATSMSGAASKEDQAIEEFKTIINFFKLVFAFAFFFILGQCFGFIFSK
jgi:hypothetical protein